MKRFLVLTVVFAGMFLMVSCGGSDSSNGDNNDNNDNGKEEEKTYCEADAEKYVCRNDISWHFECKKGEESTFSEEADFYYSSAESSPFACNSGCDPDTGKCKPECEAGQYKCVNSDMSRGLIYSCDDEKQWEPTGKACDGECAKETAESVSDLCGE